MGGLGLQPASSSGEVVIIIDGDAPAADPATAAQLRVAAAVDAAVKLTEAASARKLRSVVATAATRRGARVVVVTSGWPARDDSRVNLTVQATLTATRPSSTATALFPLPFGFSRGFLRASW